IGRPALCRGRPQRARNQHRSHCLAQRRAGLALPVCSSDRHRRDPCVEFRTSQDLDICWIEERPTSSGGGKRVRLSIVVPCYNEEAVLPETISRLGALKRELIADQHI